MDGSIWRLIDTDLNHPYFVTAADEALAISCAECNSKPILHFYRREPPGVSIGYFRKIADDVDVDLCKERGIKLVRRSSAGGSIYTDRDQLIFSLISRKPLGENVEDTFYHVCKCLIKGLESINISSVFKPPNDITINGKKISGSAQVKKKNVYLIHGTIILSIDQTILNRVLINHRPGYISSIEFECGIKPRLQILKQSLENAFAEQFNIQFQSEDFTKLELESIKKLVKEKYSSDSWNFKR